MTVMFYDLVGSTELSTRVDPEDFQTAISAFQTSCADLVRIYGGHPAKMMGDGGLIYFGYPLATEDDPLRAVTAAMAMLNQLPELNLQIRADIPRWADDLQMRIGIHTGMVVVGEVGSDFGAGRLATGETLNQAARIEGAAPVNSAAVSEATANRIRSWVELESLGRHEFKGFTEAVEIFRVDGLLGGAAKNNPANYPTSPMVGRGEILDDLAERWKATIAGNGCAVVLRGEAGIGKTRLHQALRERLAGSRHSWFEIRGSAVLSQTAFQPYNESMQHALSPDGSPIDQATISDALLNVGVTDPKIAELLAVFLGVLPERHLELTPEDQRHMTIDALCEWWVGAAQTMPLVLVAENLHWFDPSSVEMLTELISRLGDVPFMLIGTARNDFVWPWTDDVDIMDLEPLDAADITTLITHLAEDDALGGEDLAELVHRSDGIPLFAEELTYSAAFEPRGDETHVPSTLIELMQARLDRLGPRRGILQTASLLGAEFSRDVAEAIIEDDDLDATLAALVDDRFLAVRGLAGQTSYFFRHALMLDAARDSMLRGQRQAGHQNIAKVLREQFAGSAEGRPEILGHHLEHGGDAPGALAEFTKAAGIARQRVALREATAFLRRSLALLETLDPGPHRDGQQVDLQLDLGSVLGITDGFSAPATGEAYERAVELCRSAPAIEHRHFEALQGLTRFHQTGIQFDKALAVGRELQAFADKSDDRLAELSAHLTLGQVHYWQGQFAPAWQHVSSALELYDPADPVEARYAIGVESGVVAMIFAGYVAWALGDVEQSVIFEDRAIELARTQSDIYQHAHALAYASIHAIMLNDPTRCRLLASEALELARANDFLAIEGLSEYTEGWARAALGDPEGLDLTRHGVGLLAGIGAGLGAPGCMAVVAEMCADAGEIEEGEGYVMFGEAMAAESGHDFYLAEIHRSAAILHLKSADAAQDADALAANLAAAETSANRAIETARIQGSPTLELRAVQPLVDILRRRGEHEEALAALTQVVSKFDQSAVGIDLDAARHEIDSLV